MIIFFRVLCICYVLFSLNYYPFLKLDYKFMNSGYHLSASISDAEISPDLKSELLALANDTVLEIDSQIAQKYEIQKLFSICGGLFGTICFLLSFWLTKHNRVAGGI